MALKDVFKVSRKTFFNPTAWFGYGEVKNVNRTIWDILKSLFTQSALTHPETFEEAKVRLKLTEEEIQQTGQNYLIFSLIFLAFGLFGFMFGCYVLYHHATFAGFMLGIAVTSLFLAQAFRYDFWYFQIKQRKLGCTFDEWWQGKISANNQEPKI